MIKLVSQEPHRPPSRTERKLETPSVIDDVTVTKHDEHEIISALLGDSSRILRKQFRHEFMVPKLLYVGLTALGVEGHRTDGNVCVSIGATIAEDVPIEFGYSLDMPQGEDRNGDLFLVELLEVIDEHLPLSRQAL